MLSVSKRSVFVVSSTVVCGCVLVAPATADVDIEVFASSAPNFFGSPSWGGYLSNAMSGLQTGTMSIGDPLTDPTAYFTFADGEIIDAGYAMVTSYNSWVGVANPPGAFASELGNRLHFGLHASSTTQFTLADIEFEIASSDGNVLAHAGDLSGTTFNGTTRIGIDWGGDNAPGGGDDTIYVGGESDATLVNEVFYVGVGNAYWPGGGDADPTNPDLGQQGAIDDTYAYVLGEGGVDITGTYTIMGDSASTTVTLVPAPGVLALLGVAGLATRSRRRRLCCA